MSENHVTVFRKEHFNAAHRLFNHTWSEEKNKSVFGLCNNPNYHGHNYELIIAVTGIVDPDTGYVIDLKYLSDIIRERILIPLDHKNLNLDVAAFTHVNPTAEHIAIFIYNELRKVLDKTLRLKIRLYETERNFVEYPVE
jgi:6-pyruvoyltetrahydropterin/6-carboxytetrahydropterin synthase